MFCYDENPIRGKNFSMPACDPHTQWEKHYRNKMFLDFLARNPRATFDEKNQAERELIIADRKLKWWERYPGFVQEVANNIAEKVKKEWGK
jgi:hypothetical protein